MNDSTNDHAPVGNGGVMWFCHDCMGPASKIIRNISSLHKRQDEFESELKHSNMRLDQIIHEVRENNTETQKKVNDNEQKIQELQRQMNEINVTMQSVQDELQMKDESPKWSDIVNQAVESKFETVSLGLNMVEKSIEESKKKALELKDKEGRRNNVIVYKVPECPPGSYEAVIKHDSDFFLEVCTDVLGLDVMQDDIKKIYRIGKRGPEPRPLLIQLSSGMLKNHIMESTFKLRSIEKFRHVVISHDMTKDEREQCKRLVEEAKERESQEPSGEYIFRVRGPPGDMKVVKLRKRM